VRQQALQDYCDGLAESQPFKIKTEFYSFGKEWTVLLNEWYTLS
jgi:hypothetical protein